jgi:3',5'-cyclic AMP phosphodiesterase CpdA
VSDETLAWLEEELKTDKRVFVFMHHPPMTDVPTRTESGMIQNALQLQDLFGQYNVDAVFGGHIERLAHQEVDGIDYYALPGLIKSDLHYGAYYDLTITGGEADVVLYHQNDEGQYITISDFEEEAQRIRDEGVYEAYDAYLGEEERRIEELERRKAEIDAQR